MMLHRRWWKGTEMEEQFLPLTRDKIYAVSAMLKHGRYRAPANLFSRAKDEHVEEAYPWSDMLARAVTKSERSITRGIGPARQTEELLLKLVHDLQLDWDPLCAGGPVGVGSRAPRDPCCPQGRASTSKPN